MSHIDLLLQLPVHGYGVLQFLFIYLQVPRLKQTFSLNLQNSAITVRLPREPCRRREGYRSLCEIFRWTDRNFPQFHCSDIGKSALFAGARSLQFSTGR
jgi:hypothetical protein